jgi:hypothetical protein
MSKSRLLVLASICSLVAVPTITNAQVDSTKEQAQEFVHDVLRALMIVPNWNVSLHGGFSTSDRFVLQRAANTIDGQRALNSSTGFNIGFGAGADILLRMGFRANYTFSSSGLNFKTDDGTGSNGLNVDNVGTVKTHTVALEVMRYMLPSRSAITPYGTLGVQGTWWVLDEKSALVTSAGASTPFALGPLFTFGVQFKASDRWSGRMEASLSSGHNPFTGNSSFRALSGPTIDEPTSVSRTDYRIAGVYHFGKPTLLTGAKPIARK